MGRYRGERVNIEEIVDNLLGGELKVLIASALAGDLEAKELVNRFENYQAQPRSEMNTVLLSLAYSEWRALRLVKPKAGKHTIQPLK
jgi:hypothetical protein